MRKLFNAWQSLGIFGKLLIVAIPIALILFSAICMDTNWDEFITTEQDYVALEEVAYEIIETQNVMQPLEGNLKHYIVEFADDGTIEIILYGNAESLHFTVTEDFQVKSFYRRAFYLKILQMRMGEYCFQHRYRNHRNDCNHFHFKHCFNLLMIITLQTIKPMCKRISY